MLAPMLHGWPLLAIASVAGLIGYAYVYRHRPEDDE